MSLIGSQHTLGHSNCLACEEIRQSVMFGAQFGELYFPEAATLWLRQRNSLSSASRKHYRDYIDSLTKFFGCMKLSEIHIGHLVAYQRSRQEAIRCSARHRAGKRDEERRESDGASRINHEISCLGQVLKKAGLWDEIKKFYEPLPLPGSAGMALTDEEADHLFQVARSKKRWMVAYCCALVMVSTTADPGEIKHLRLKDITLDSPEGPFIHINTQVKNVFRRRPVPLNADAEKAMRWLLARARELGAVDPDHYLLPHRATVRGGAPDPTRPMDSWKTAHYGIRREAAKRFPRLARLRLKDYRHTAATDLLEDPSVSYATIEHMLGHRLNSNTKRIYDHLRNTALRGAAVALNRNRASSELAVPAKKPIERIACGVRDARSGT